MNIAVFEDAAVDKLYPVTTGRPAYAISCASFRLVDWLVQLGGPLIGMVRSHMKMMQLMDFPQFQQELDGEHEWTLVINARLVPSLGNFESLRSLLDRRSACIVRNNWSLSVAVLPTSALVGKTDANFSKAIETCCNNATDEIEMLDVGFQLFDYPHDIVRFNQEWIERNLGYRIASGKYREVSDNVFAAEGAILGEHVVADSKAGPVVLEERASIGPYTFLSGPAFIGADSRVIEHSAIKDAVSIGHTTKIGGEVEASVIESYTNKQHHGFLGHSYLGSWINLGAGTCNSDLKNTYGEVKMEYRGEKVTTGMQFVGCIIGDYAKTAINTSIFTGKVIGTCSMVYGFVTTNVASFVNYARSFGQVTELPPSVMEATQRRMFQRRNVEQRPGDIQMLHDMYTLTRHERQLAEEPLIF